MSVMTVFSLSLQGHSADTYKKRQLGINRNNLTEKITPNMSAVVVTLIMYLEFSRFLFWRELMHVPLPFLCLSLFCFALDEIKISKLLHVAVAL